MTFHYFYDALCGWCYGFSPVVQAFYEKHQKDLDFEVIAGGMIMGERVGPIGKVAPYIKQAYRQVEEKSGVHFGEKFLKDILDKGETIFTSLPSAKALAAVKSIDASKAISASSLLLRSVYEQGMEPKEDSTYEWVFQQLDIAPELGLKTMKEAQSMQKAEEDFKKSAAWGINGFPSVVLENDGKYYLIARGFSSLENLEEGLNAVRSGSLDTPA